MVKHVEPHRLSGLQVGKSGISGGTGKAVICSKHLRIANKKEGMCSRVMPYPHTLSHKLQHTVPLESQG